ncbi:MAG: family 43 glycosylhydrolase [Candidatus Latescibacterota bacterium]
MEIKFTHSYAAAALAIAAAVLLTGCDKKTAPADEAACCDDGAPPIFLLSKIDDDDDDGNPFDEDFPTIDDEDDDIADHTWIRDLNGLYHLFFQNEDRGVGSHIEHYTSTDLRSLDYVGTALRADPGGWDSYGLWAPHVIRSGNTYYMFYTGADGPGADPGTKQRIGLATSPDLMTWTRFPGNRCPGTPGEGCVYQCDEPWTTWGGPDGSFNQQCRDPFVMWDSDNQRWVMMVTARSTNRYGVVTVAYSDDLTTWTGAGFIDATRRLADGVGAQTTGGQAENPFVMSYDGTHYLLFTDWNDPEDSVSVQDPRTIVQYATSNSLAADTLGSAQWIYRGYTPDPAVNAIEVQRIGKSLWVMSQSLSNQRNGLWKRRRQLRMMCVVWMDNYEFDTVNANLPCGTAPEEAGITGVGPAFRRR